MIEQRNAVSGRATPDREVAAPTPAAPEEWAASVENLAAEAERKLKKAASGHEALQDDLRQLVAAFREVRTFALTRVQHAHGREQKLDEAEKAQAELQRSKAQCDLVKNLLADVTEEKEIMYEVRGMALGADATAAYIHV